MTTLFQEHYNSEWQAEYTKDCELKAAYCNGKKVRLTPARIHVINQFFADLLADETGTSFVHSLSQII